uniref:DNA replication helicase subunit n=1 Tax=Polyopes affinis TaxID=194519 RepID=UPI002A8417A6|nr:DNA replication helicase subunit [Polyopes affinis]WOL37027.1 DNA replication helicase subunit [Polyopes affinis]
MYFYLFPPQNYLAEEILLGTILINPSIFPQITPIIKPESFFLECHQIIYRNLINIHKQNKLDTLQLLYSLSNTNELIIIGGIQKVIELMKQSQVFTSSRNIIIYAKELVEIINHNYIKRLMIQYGYNIIGLAYIKKFPSYQLYNRATNYLSITVQQIPKENIDNFKTLIGDFLLNFDAKRKSSLVIEEIKANKHLILSGFDNLDKLTNGLPNGDLIVIAGRPSTGKTSLAINIIYNIITNLHIGICLFSLEMSKMQILQKLISIASTIPTQQIILNSINNAEWQTIQKICEELLSSDIYLNDTPNMSVDYIEYTSKLLKKETRCIGIIIIDYLQLIQSEGVNHDNRSQELSYITRKLKLLAQNLNVPIIILSQLNRSIETRINKQPILSDLRESGCLDRKVLLNTDYLNYLNIVSIFSYNNKHYNIKIAQTNSADRLPDQFIKEKRNNIDNNIRILIQYIFKIKVKTYNYIKITQNHKLYTKLKWIKQNFIGENEKLLRYRTHITKNNNILENLYTTDINYVNYSIVYDIFIKDYSNFLSQNIILHNSIEQDADIVMMLYENIKNQQNDSKFKVLDILLCKNRNGPTGSCQILFSLDNTTFKNLQSRQLLDIAIENEQII